MLHRYLIGEDVAGPNTSAFYPDPVELQHLPMSADERPEHWCGPDRSIGAVWAVGCDAPTSSAGIGSQKRDDLLEGAGASTVTGP